MWGKTKHYVPVVRLKEVENIHAFDHSTRVRAVMMERNMAGYSAWGHRVKHDSATEHTLQGKGAE